MEHIRLYNHFTDDGSCNTTLLFDSARALAKFRLLLTAPRGGEASVPEASMDTVSMRCLYEIVLTIHEQMNEESFEFIEKVFHRATYIVHTDPPPHFQAFTYDALGCAQPRSPWQSRISLSTNIAGLHHFYTSSYPNCKRSILQADSEHSRGSIQDSKGQHFKRHRIPHRIFEVGDGSFE